MALSSRERRRLALIALGGGLLLAIAALAAPLLRPTTSIEGDALPTAASLPTTTPRPPVLQAAPVEPGETDLPSAVPASATTAPTLTVTAAGSPTNPPPTPSSTARGATTAAPVQAPTNPVETMAPAAVQAESDEFANLPDVPFDDSLATPLPVFASPTDSYTVEYNTAVPPAIEQFEEDPNSGGAFPG